jgi:hypothetical protein
MGFVHAIHPTNYELINYEAVLDVQMTYKQCGGRAS